MAIQDEKVIIVNQMSDEIGDLAVYGYQNFVKFRTDSGKEVHFIVADTTPNGVATWDSSPVGSIFFYTGGGNDTTAWLKETSVAAGWAPITTGAAA